MFQIEQVSIVIITLVIIAFIFYFRAQLKKAENGGELNRGLVAVIELIRYLDGFTRDAMGDKHGRRLSAYISSVFIYILLSNVSGLFGLEAPTTNWSVTLALSLISWVLIQIASIQTNGWSGYLKGYLDPFFVFLPMNVLSEIGTILSLSLRLFGNLIAGSVLMGLLYGLGSWLSGLFPVIGQFNFLGPIITPAFHLYFDLFSGAIQAFVFMSLTTIFIGMEFQGDPAE